MLFKDDGVDRNVKGDLERELREKMAFTHVTSDEQGVKLLVSSIWKIRVA